MRLLLAFAALLLCAAGPVTYGQAVFDLPDGWERSKDASDGVLFKRDFPRGPDQRQPGGAIILVRKPVGGPFEANFRAFATSTQGLANERPMQRRAGLTVNGHRVMAENRCCGTNGSAPVANEAVGIDTGAAGQHFLMLVTVNLRGNSSKAARADFEALVRTYRPTAADRAFAVTPQPGDGGLDGAWTTLRTGLRPNAFGGMDFYSDSEVLLLRPDGLLSREMPAGVEDVAGHCRRKPGDCGTYRVSGGQITTRDVVGSYGMFEVKEEPLARDGAGLRIGTAEYRPLAPFPAESVLDGTWRSLSGSSGSTAFSSGSVAVERTLTLDRAGRWRRTGSTSVAMTNDAGGSRTGIAGTTNRPAQTGRYTLEGFVLTLTGDDGQAERLSVFRPDGASDGLLVVNGNNYLKR